MTTGMSFHSGTPTNDPITGEAFFEENAYVRLADEGEDRLAGLEVAKQLVASKLAAPVGVGWIGRARDLPGARPCFLTHRPYQLPEIPSL